jgi:hypothetical protein
MFTSKFRGSWEKLRDLEEMQMWENVKDGREICGKWFNIIISRYVGHRKKVRIIIHSLSITKLFGLLSLLTK